MAGLIFRIPKRMYDFSGLPSGGTATIPMATGLDMSQVREAVVVVRLHSDGTNWTNLQSFGVSARLDAPTREDPGVDFFGTTDLGTNVGFLQGTDSPPMVKFFMLTNSTAANNLPAMIRIVIKGIGGTSAATFQVSVSVEVYGRS